MRPTRITRPFAGRDHAFDVAPLGTIEALERACNAGMGEILSRLQGDTWREGDKVAYQPRFRHADIRETIRLGLMGAGMSEPEATALIRDTVDGRPVMPFLVLAVEIVVAYAHGVDDAVKKSEGPAGEAMAPPPGPETSVPTLPPAS